MLATREETAMGYPEISTLLWREREALNLLLFKLIEEQLVVAAGQVKWLPQANHEVELALEQVRGAEVLLAAEIESFVADAGLGRPSLLTVCKAAPEPWATVLGEHREAVLKLVADVARTTDDNRTLLQAGARSVRETMLSITDTVDVYDSRGTAAPTVSRPRLMDERA
jgi:hypothetical protein